MFLGLFSWTREISHGGYGKESYEIRGDFLDDGKKITGNTHILVGGLVPIVFDGKKPWVSGFDFPEKKQTNPLRKTRCLILLEGTVGWFVNGATFQGTWLFP